ncbi:MAG: hypothetical protein JJ916_00195 [Phycisphaerales bacterium]|nr:hypothetical protein [Phycisphaerales bacterium]
MMTLAACIAGAGAQTIKGGWTICTRDLRLRETLIERANERELTLMNSYGIRSVMPMDEVLFVVKTAPDQPAIPGEIVGVPSPEPSPVRLITLTDGQTVRGSIIESDLPEYLGINLIAGMKMHGDAHVSLERVLRIVDQDVRDPHPPAELLDDLVVLRNGDRVSGFVESIGPVVRVALDDTAIELESARIQQIHIANESAPLDGIYLRFADREVIRVLGFRYSAQSPIEISVDPVSLGMLETGHTEWRLNSGSLDSLWVSAPGQRVVSLASIEPEDIEPVGGRAWVPTPIVLNENATHEALRSIDFRSPARVSYPLPEGASRFACSIEVPIEEWTDCVLRVITVGSGRERQIFEQRMRLDASTASINTSLPQGVDSIIIEIDPGEHGPIQDRVIMHHPRVLAGE